MGQRDVAANGVHMPDSCSKARSMNRKFYHCGSHDGYSLNVQDDLKPIINTFNKGKINAQQARNKK